MTISAFIDQVLQFGYDIQDLTTSPTAQTTKTRERILRATQAACEAIRNAFPWRFRFADTGSIAVASVDYSGPLPNDFQAYGPRTTVYRDDGKELRRRNISEVRRLRKTNPSTGSPELWAPLGEDYIEVYPAGVDPTLAITDYLQVCPTLADDQTTDLATAIPERFQRQILFDLVVSDLKLMGGDDNDIKVKLEAEKRLRQMWADENLMPGASRVPRYGRGHLRA